jgi:hypothetical protein
MNSKGWSSVPQGHVGDDRWSFSSFFAMMVQSFEELCKPKATILLRLYARVTHEAILLSQPLRTSPAKLANSL